MDIRAKASTAAFNPHSTYLVLGAYQYGISSTHVVASTTRSEQSVVRAFGWTQIGKQSIHSKKLCKRIKPHKLHRVHYHFNLCCEQSRLFCLLIRPTPPPPPPATPLLPRCRQLLLLSSSLFRIWCEKRAPFIPAMFVFRVSVWMSFCAWVPYC